MAKVAPKLMGSISKGDSKTQIEMMKTIFENLDLDEI